MCGNTTGRELPDKALRVDVIDVRYGTLWSCGLYGFLVDRFRFWRSFVTNSVYGECRHLAFQQMLVLAAKDADVVDF